MQAVDLMVGNWVMYEDKYYQMGAISERLPLLNTIELGVGVVEWKDLQPIPLTPEILAKCPQIKIFEAAKQSPQYTIHNRLFLVRNDAICDYGTGFEPRYLHTLQKFIKLLTNEELIVNL